MKHRGISGLTPGREVEITLLNNTYSKTHRIHGVITSQELQKLTKHERINPRDWRRTAAPVAFAPITTDTEAIRALRTSDATSVIIKMKVSRALIEGRTWRDTLTYPMPTLLATIGSQGVLITADEILGFDDMEKRVFNTPPPGTKMTGLDRKKVDTLKGLYEGIPDILASEQLEK